jgi:hypothetical protein
MSKEEESKKDKNRKLRVKKIVAKKIKVEKEKKLKLREAANPGKILFYNLENFILFSLLISNLDDQKLKKQLAMEKLRKESKNSSNNLKIMTKVGFNRK